MIVFNDPRIIAGPVAHSVSLSGWDWKKEGANETFWFLFGGPDPAFIYCGF